MDEQSRQGSAYRRAPPPSERMAASAQSDFAAPSGDRVRGAFSHLPRRVLGDGLRAVARPAHEHGLPTLIGMAKQGATVAASSGVWNTTTPVVFTYQWQLCDAAGENCVDVGGAGAATRTLAAEAVGHTVRVVVTATSAAGSQTAASEVSAVVVAIPANAPRNTAPPTLRGETRVGQRLRVDKGAWNGASRIRFTYEWQRCDATGGSCVPVARVTGARYRLTVADANKTIRVIVTASNTGGTNTAVSKQTIVVTGPTAPTNTREPQISGGAVVGSTLTATRGRGAARRRRLPISGLGALDRVVRPDASDCAAIGGATTGKYVAGKADVGKTLRVRVTAKNANGSKTAASNATAVVKDASTPTAPINTGEPRISGGAVVGSTLTATQGTWSGSPTSFAFSGLRCPSAPGAPVTRRTAPRSAVPRPASTLPARPMSARRFVSGSPPRTPTARRPPPPTRPRSSRTPARPRRRSTPVSRGSVVVRWSARR